LVEEIREELTFKQLARDEDGKGLVWTGEAQPAVQPAIPIPGQPAAAEITAVTSPAAPLLSSPRTETPTSANGPTATVETASADVSQDEPAVPREPTRSLPEAERRQLTVMFCDLADSTRLSQQLDPEDLREVVRAYQEIAAEVIYQYEGHIAQYLGDGLLIYFGWPVSHEDDARRALLAGLGIVEVITTTLNQRLETEKGVQLTVRLGVHTGPVVVGKMGGGGRHENLATGETVNVTARLEGLARPNTVVVSHVTARLVEGAFTLEDLGPHALKGVAEPMQVFRVISPVEVYENETGVVGVPFLVGRDEEVGLLLRRWQQSKEALGQAVLISGEAGIGKSSLLAAMRAHVRQEGCERITMRCSPYHQNSALHPMITHLDHRLGLTREDTPDIKLDKLERTLRASGLSLEETVPLFAMLLSIPFNNRYVTPTLSPQQNRQRTLDTLVGWLLAQAEQQPVLVAWEDLHWADPSTLEMLGLVLEQTPTVPMLHVLTCRPEFTPPWVSRSHMTPLTLNRLERPQVEALIRHQSKGKALPAEVVEHIVAKTDGAPLYVEELTKMLLESDLLREQEDQYTLTGPLSTVSIPDTLQASLMARLDQLNMAKEVAQMGAVLGREFTYEILQAISSQDEETLQVGLARLVEAELLYQRGRPPRAHYLFKHALIQDAAYTSLLRSTRQRVHQQVARQLEAHFPKAVETEPELLAHHYTEANLLGQAVPYWQRAGQVAQGRSAHHEAIAHLNQGLRVLTTLPETRARDQQELPLRIDLGKSLIATKGWASPETEAAYTRAWEICQQTRDTSWPFAVLWGLSNVYVVRADLTKHREVGAQFLSLAEQQSDAILLLVAHYLTGQNLLHVGEYVTGLAHFNQACALYDPQHHHTYVTLFGVDVGVFALSYISHALWGLGYPEQAVQRSREALALAQKVEHPFSIALAQAYAAMLQQFRREPSTATKHAEIALTVCTEQGFAYYLAWATIIQGWALAETGRREAGIAQMHQGLTTLQATGGGLRIPYYLTLLAEADGEVGQAEEGLHLLVGAASHLDKTQDRWVEAELYRLRGDLLLAVSPDNHLAAEACFHQALDIARHQQATSLELRAAISLARLWQSQGKRQEAYDLLALVYGWFTEGFDTADLQEAKTLLQELA
jgi:predicted ATPase/class 3 adenylate cyclase